MIDDDDDDDDDDYYYYYYYYYSWQRLINQASNIDTADRQRSSHLLYVGNTASIVL